MHPHPEEGCDTETIGKVGCTITSIFNAAVVHRNLPITYKEETGLKVNSVHDLVLKAGEFLFTKNNLVIWKNAASLFNFSIVNTNVTDLECAHLYISDTD